MTDSFKFPLILLIPALTVAAMVGVGLGVQLAPSIVAHSQPAAAQQTSAYPNSHNSDNLLIAQLQQRIDQLQSENQRLYSQLQDRSPQKHSSQAEEVADTASSKLLKDKIDLLESEKQKRKANDVNNWIMDKQKTDKKFDVNKELSDRFERESIDPVWAEKQENHYRQLFGSQENLSDFALRDTRCRSTECEVTFSISSPEQSFQLLNAISSKLQGAEILVATDAAQGVSKLYISSQKGFELN